MPKILLYLLVDQEPDVQAYQPARLRSAVRDCVRDSGDDTVILMAVVEKDDGKLENHQLMAMVDGEIQVMHEAITKLAESKVLSCEDVLAFEYAFVHER